MRRALPFALLILLAGCAVPGARQHAIVEVTPQPDAAWREAISVDDASRLAAIAAQWSDALAAAKRHYAAAIAAEGPLLDPNAALDNPAPSPGAYRCRVVKLGAPNGRGRAFRTYPPYACYIRGQDDALTFTKQTGTELPVGWLYPDGNTRFIFLGAYGEGTKKPPSYGQVPGRDAAGVVERVAPFRWRLTLLPRNRNALLTIYELTPVPAESQPA